MLPQHRASGSRHWELPHRRAASVRHPLRHWQVPPEASVLRRQQRPHSPAHQSELRGHREAFPPEERDCQFLDLEP